MHGACRCSNHAADIGCRSLLLLLLQPHCCCCCSQTRGSINCLPCPCIHHWKLCPCPKGMENHFFYLKPNHVSAHTNKSQRRLGQAKPWDLFCVSELHNGAQQCEHVAGLRGAPAAVLNQPLCRSCATNADHSAGKARTVDGNCCRAQTWCSDSQLRQAAEANGRGGDRLPYLEELFYTGLMVNLAVTPLTGEGNTDLQKANILTTIIHLAGHQDKSPCNMIDMPLLTTMAHVGWQGWQKDWLLGLEIPAPAQLVRLRHHDSCCRLQG